MSGIFHTARLPQWGVGVPLRQGMGGAEEAVHACVEKIHIGEF